MKKLIYTLAFLLAGSGAAQSAVVAYSNEAAFQSALGGFTVIDTGANLGKTTAQLSADTIGADFFGPDSYVRSDNWILNGAGFFGSTTPHVGLNFTDAVNGVGVTSNPGDGGTILIYSGLNATGVLLGSTAFGTATGSLFGGIISSGYDIKSAVFTCEYDWDLKCGLRNPTFGSATAIPAPAMLGLLGAGLLGIPGLSRRA